MSDKSDCSDCDEQYPEKYIERGLCPKCRMNQDVKARERHQMTRDPTKEPY